MVCAHSSIFTRIISCQVHIVSIYIYVFITGTLQTSVYGSSMLFITQSVYGLTPTFHILVKFFGLLLNSRPPSKDLYSPVTYISMPSLKVKMVVVLVGLLPCFTSPMLS